MVAVTLPPAADSPSSPTRGSSSRRRSSALTGDHRLEGIGAANARRSSKRQESGFFERPDAKAAAQAQEDAFTALGRSKFGELVAHVVASNYDGVRRWLQQYQRVDLTDAHGWTALHWAAANNSSPQIVELLVTRMKADVNKQTLNKWTPLHFAVYNHHTLLVDQLLRLGATPAAKDDQGCTAEDYAKDCGFTSLQTTLFDFAQKRSRNMFKGAYEGTTARLRERRQSEASRSALQAQISLSLQEERRRKDREMQKRRHERDRARQLERRKQTLERQRREFIREVSEREMIQRLSLMELADLALDTYAERELIAREEADEGPRMRRLRRAESRRKSRRLSVGVSSAGSMRKIRPPETLSPRSDRIASPRGGRKGKRREAEEVRQREREERERAREREIAEERRRQRELEEKQAREAEADLRRRELLADWLETVEMTHTGEYEFFPADGGGWRWTCCGERQERGEGCVVADDRYKPQWHPGEWKFHVDDCRCGVIGGAPHRTSAVAPPAAAAGGAPPSPARTQAVKWLDTGGGGGAPQAKQGGLVLPDLDRSLMFTQEDIGGGGERKHNSEHIFASSLGRPSPGSRGMPLKEPSPRAGQTYCAPGSFCWTCCGSLEEMGSGCTLQKALRQSKPTFIQPTWQVFPPECQSLRLTPDPPEVANLDFDAPRRGQAYRLLSVAAGQSFSGNDCVYWEVLIESCGPALQGDYITVGIVSETWLQTAALTGKCYEFLGDSMSLGWWSEYDLVSGMGRRDRTRELSSGKRARYHAGDTVGVLIDCLNKEVNFFVGRQHACTVKLPAVLGRVPVSPAITLHPGARISLRPSVKTAPTMALRGVAREREVALVEWAEKRYREEKEARESALRSGAFARSVSLLGPDASPPVSREAPSRKRVAHLSP
eukprot:TRINITY_DN50565_c0_g1_i1.p1 TRINITY_DN50565_c0_g1~~TRINITY_DN50565_c0_g1_i1.p1  ORF type:complete len:922 (+),score=210.35 TRINITY_DN50565_c0_g1_i1:81-2768(+)